MADDNGGLHMSLNLDPVSAKRFLGLFQQMLETTLKKMLAEALVRPAPSPSPEPKESAPPLPTKTGIDLKAIEKLKAADLRLALLIGKTPENSGLLIDTKTFAKLMAISVATLYRLHAEQALPDPIHIGNVKRWRLAEILEWLEAGCPPQKVWLAKKSADLRRKGT